jgi:hypothetical protein
VELHGLNGLSFTLTLKMSLCSVDDTDRAQHGLFLDTIAHSHALIFGA